MDKKEVIKKIIKKLRIEIKELEKNYERVREVVITAPGAMQSASDTTRMTESEIAEKMQMAMFEKREIISFLENEIQVDNISEIQMGSLVQIQNDYDKQYFLLLLKGGGLRVEIDSKTIMTLTPEAPMAQAILNKKVGDQVEINIAGTQRKIEVLEIF